MQLRAFREIAIYTIGGAHDANTYVVGVRISGVDIGGIELAVAPVLARHGLIALLGRDFLVGRTFLYDGHTGAFSLDIEASESVAELTPEG